MKLIAIDCETTGLDDYPLSHEVIEIAAQVWEDGERGPLYVKRFMPCGPVDPGAAKANGFTPEKWGAVQEAAGIPCRPFSFDDAGDLYRMIVPPQGDTVEAPLGANIAFDMRFLREAFRRVRHPFPAFKTHRTVDVQALAIPLVVAGKIPNASLKHIAEFYGIDTSAAHSAAGDVNMTIQVFERLVLEFLPAAKMAPRKEE